MPPLRLAIQLTSLRQPLRQALHTAARLGATAVEIDARNQLRPGELSETGVRELRFVLDELNLRVVSVAFPTRRGYDEADDLDRRVEATKQAMTFAWQLRAPIVVNQVGRIPAEPQGVAWEQLIAVLRDLSDHGQRCGARLAVQTGAASGADLARLLGALPAQGIAVDFDPGNLLIHGFSPAEEIGAVAGDVAQLRARDAVRDLARGRGLEVPLGRGSVDFPMLLAALEERNFRGPVILARDQAADPEAELANAMEYLQRL